MAASPFPQIPQPPGSQASPPPGGGNPLLGTNAIPPAGPTPDQRLTAYMDQVRNISIQIDSLAQSHPEASQELNQAKDALTNSLSKVSAATAQMQSTPQPPTF
jgi:hypothetical protein